MCVCVWEGGRGGGGGGWGGVGRATTPNSFDIHVCIMVTVTA